MFIEKIELVFDSTCKVELRQVQVEDNLANKSIE